MQYIIVRWMQYSYQWVKGKDQDMFLIASTFQWLAHFLVDIVALLHFKYWRQSLLQTAFTAVSQC